MARSSRPRVIDSSDDDSEFPALDKLVRPEQEPASRGAAKSYPETSQRPKAPQAAKASKVPASVRRRKLGPVSDNTLLRAWTPDSTAKEDDSYHATEEKSRPRRLRVQLRTRQTTTPSVSARPLPNDEHDDYDSTHEITITEDISLADDVFHSAESGGSEFGGEESEDEFKDSVVEIIPSRPPPKPRLPLSNRKPSGPTTINEMVKKEKRTAAGRSSRGKESASETACGAKKGKASTKGADNDLTDTLARLQLNDPGWLADPQISLPRDRNITPPSTPPKPKAGLVSPKKLARIPATPHRPEADIFWSREFVDDWNDEHSPRKQLFPDPSTIVAPKAASPKKKAGPKESNARETKKAFEQVKHDMADKFLRELDTVITNGKLAELAASTGGIKLNWTNKLNTTAGRANWKRETIRTKTAAGETMSVVCKHHASIELAEKVIDDEHRLLNVVAHEFCHLANFMVSGITTNPHGREFKAWAAQCSRAFGSRGIEVTTKHSYDIDFKYIWTCADCGMEYKRHSKSVHPERHRCGGCRGELKQTKPVPRGTGVGGAGAKKPSEYQTFMKEEMKRIREGNPGSPQKDIMKQVAAKWAQRQRSPGLTTPTGEDSVDAATKRIEILIVDEE
ncbi:SprT-like family-domain-containing protein [Lasiosphaeria hispida]|uniref:SprT-like family-domain-containing protein n=1 Tax=Lasiosphaeria hispida TaxID=260671 RepID=A0AAJ0HBR7_9PEZI|nr:SprT-like family-domain-containing protein [Lasiosphaeria hispida]